jgi:hypothetical protein
MEVDAAISLLGLQSAASDSSSSPNDIPPKIGNSKDIADKSKETTKEILKVAKGFGEVVIVKEVGGGESDDDSEFNLEEMVMVVLRGGDGGDVEKGKEKGSGLLAELRGVW